MPISDGKNRLKKIAFQVGDTFFRFAINPENYKYSAPQRATAVKTKSRIVVEDFQSDIPSITITGTTGFNPTGRTEDRGFTKIKELKKFIENYSEMGGNGNKASDDFYFHNFTNDESYVVHLSPQAISITQDVQSPLTYKYEIQLTVLRKAGEPAEEDIVDPEIGNRFPSLPKGPAPHMSPYRMPDGSVDWQHVPEEDKVDRRYDPSGGTDNVYNTGKYSPYRSAINSDPINPQAPSPTSYEYGTTGLGYSIGYYGRRN